jgi:hypothetical protein
LESRLNFTNSSFVFTNLNFILRFITLLRGDNVCSFVYEKEGSRDENCKYCQTTPDDSLRCNICGRSAEYVIQLELIKERSNYNIMKPDDNMPFYLCKVHEYIYKKMRTSIELKNYFEETIMVNQ